MRNESLPQEINGIRVDVILLPFEHLNMNFILFDFILQQNLMLFFISHVSIPYER